MFVEDALLRVDALVHFLQDGRVVREVLLVVLHNNAGRLQHVPRVVNPPPQVRLLSAACPGWGLVIGVGVVPAALFHRACRQVRFVPDRVALQHIALAANAVGLIDRACAFEIELDDDAGDLGVGHELLGLDDVYHLLSNAFEARGLLGTALVDGEVAGVSRESVTAFGRGVTEPWPFLLGLEEVSQFLARGAECRELTRLVDRSLHLTRVKLGVGAVGGDDCGKLGRASAVFECDRV